MLCLLCVWLFVELVSLLPLFLIVFIVVTVYVQLYSCSSLTSLYRGDFIFYGLHIGLRTHWRAYPLTCGQKNAGGLLQREHRIENGES